MIFFLIIAYLVGSIPFGLILTRLAGYGDIRAIGSGNIGATNVLRTGNKKLAALTLFLDGGKGVLSVVVLGYLADIWGTLGHDPYFDNRAVPLVALCTVLGHMFPVWLKFKGGKGVATALGVFLAATPWAGLAAIAAWLAAAYTFRFSSLAAMAAMTVAPVVTFFIYGTAPAAACAAIAMLVWLRHRANIARLLKGEEPKIGKTS